MKSTVAALGNPPFDALKLRSNRKLATDYAKAAVDGLNDPQTRGESLRALRAIAEAFGQIDKIALKAGITRR